MKKNSKLEWGLLSALPFIFFLETPEAKIYFGVVLVFTFLIIEMVVHFLNPFLIRAFQIPVILVIGLTLLEASYLFKPSFLPLLASSTVASAAATFILLNFSSSKFEGRAETAAYFFLFVLLIAAVQSSLWRIPSPIFFLILAFGFIILKTLLSWVGWKQT